MTTTPTTELQMQAVEDAIAALRKEYEGATVGKWKAEDECSRYVSTGAYDIVCKVEAPPGVMIAGIRDGRRANATHIANSHNRLPAQIADYTERLEAVKAAIFDPENPPEPTGSLTGVGVRVGQHQYALADLDRLHRVLVAG